MSYRKINPRFVICIIAFSLILNLIPLQYSFSQVKLVKADEYLDGLVTEQKFSGSVLVVKGGEILLKKGYGMANYELDVPNKPNTKFRIGSLTKQFTSMLIMMLVDEDKISIDGKLTDYLDYYRKDTGGKITVHHLLTHTSGIPSYTGFEGFFANDSRDTYKPKDFIEKYCMHDLEFEPGSKFVYNNSAYFILGALIEEVSGKTYKEFLQERIFDPLGMYDSGYDNHNRIIKNRARGYRLKFGKIENDNYLDMSIPFSAGSLYSTVENLYKWDRELYETGLVSKSSYEKIFTPNLNNYGYGWGISERNGRKVTRHTGGINGFQSIITRYINDDACIIILSNLTSGQTRNISAELEKYIFGTSK